MLLLRYVHVCLSGDPSEDLLQRVICSDDGGLGEQEGEGEDKGEGVGKGGMVLQYYLKVMSLFEKVSCPLAVLDIAEKAVVLVEKSDPLSVSLTMLSTASNVFASIAPTS